MIPLICIFAVIAFCFIGRQAPRGRMQTNGGWVQFIPAAVSLASGLFGKKKAPAAIPTKEVNLQEEQRKALEGNLANQDQIEDLLTKANKFSQTQASDLMELAAPGYSKLSSSILKAGQEKIDNPYDLPEEFIANLDRLGAERGVSRGTRGQFNQYDIQRDIGVNMLEFGKSNFAQALNALTTVSGTAPRISPMSPLSMYVTPQQTAQVAAGNNANNQATAQAGANSQTAASNFNTQNLWDSLAQAAGVLTAGGGGRTGEAYTNSANDD